MKRFIILIIYCILVLQLNAKNRVGVIIDLDTQFHHSFIGILIVENSITDYDVYLDLESACFGSVKSNLENNYGNLTFVSIDKAEFKKLQEQKENLKRKEFKKYKEKWLSELKEKYNLIAIMYIENIKPIGTYDNYKVAKSGYLSGINKDKGGIVYIQLYVHLYSGSSIKPKHIYSYLTGYEVSGVVPPEEGEYMRDEDIKKCEAAMKKSINQQIRSFPQHQNYMDFVNYIIAHKKTPPSIKE